MLNFRETVCIYTLLIVLGRFLTRFVDDRDGTPCPWRLSGMGEDPGPVYSYGGRFQRTETSFLRLRYNRPEMDCLIAV